MNPTDLETILRERLLVADGSTGSALAALCPSRSSPLSLLPLEEPGLVLDLHRAYLAAGSDLIETATFSASARSLERAGARVDPRMLNRAAAELARRACREAGTAEAHWVAGSVGPGEEAPSLGAVSRRALIDSYLPQMLGLVEGGIDLVLIETCQDPLQAKAAISALRAADRILGTRTPFAISATIDASSGGLLTGTSIEAFVAILAPFHPLALGLNCSGGPDALAVALDKLAAISPFPLTLMPNAGLPRLVEGRECYPLGPNEFARETAILARRHGVSLVGGCCGTLPEHIAALVRQLGERPVPASRPRRPSAAPVLASLYESKPIGETVFRIGERANAAGSAAFAKLAKAGDLEGMVALALGQERQGAMAIDLHVARPGRDEAADLSTLVRALSPRARSALSLDSADLAALEAALDYVSGRGLLNSVSLENAGKARRVFALAREHGAAVICLALGPGGPARRADEKTEICRELARLALDEGLDVEDLLFDPVTFPLAASTKGLAGAARETLLAIPRIKAAIPGARVVLGVGNVSFGLQRSLRPEVTALFLEEAREAGLDAAILDVGGLPKTEAIRPELREAALALIRADADTDTTSSLEALLAFGGDTGKASKESAAVPSSTAPDPAATPPSLLSVAVREGRALAAAEAAEAILGAGGGVRELSEIVGTSLEAVGADFARGIMPLPLVLKSAEAAEKVFGRLAACASENGGEKGTVVIATVRGDLHDIGKNLAGLIIAGAGYHVVDLGVDARAEDILAAVEAESAVALGLSGLLLRSLAEMETMARLLAARNSTVLLLLGGAAVDTGFVASHIEPLRPGLVRACRNPFEALRVLEALRSPDGKERAVSESLRREFSGPSEESPQSRTPESPILLPREARTKQAVRELAPTIVLPPALGRLGPREPVELGEEELLAALDRKTLLQVRWGYGRARREEAEEILDEILASLQGKDRIGGRAVYGYFAGERKGDALLIASPGGDARFPFPTSSKNVRNPLEILAEGEVCLVPFFAVTVGRTLSGIAGTEFEAGVYDRYFQLHCLGAALAEAAAEATHRRIKEELVAAGLVGFRGGKRRFSFGFPSCPGLEHQGSLLALLGADRVEIGLTEGFQLVPEFSVTAFIDPLQNERREEAKS